MSTPSFCDVWYYDGRQGKKLASNNPEYRKGYLDGEAAKEEAENGYRPGVDGGQW